MHSLVLYGIGLVLVIVIMAIRMAAASAKARKLLQQAEEAERQGDLPGAAAHYKKLALAVAANGKEFPMWLGRLTGIYGKMGVSAPTDGILEAHRAILDIWKSKMSDSEKKRLHRTAMESLRTQLDALP
jgi:hypothetical protein